jgi:hypothetical protein
MKKLLILVVFLVTGTMTIFAQNARDTLPKGKTTKAAKVVYTCPMHPEVTSDKPGKCPKCGMDLVKKKSVAKNSNMHGMKMDSSMKGMKMDSTKH